MEILALGFEFDWELFPKIQVTLFRCQAITWAFDDPIHLSVYVPVSPKLFNAIKQIQIISYE